MREYEFKPLLFKKLSKISKKDQILYEAVLKKVEEIINVKNPDHYKKLKKTTKSSKKSPCNEKPGSRF